MLLMKMFLCNALTNSTSGNGSSGMQTAVRSGIYGPAATYSSAANAGADAIVVIIIVDVTVLVIVMIVASVVVLVIIYTK